MIFKYNYSVKYVSCLRKRSILPNLLNPNNGVKPSLSEFKITVYQISICNSKLVK